jgi:competence protein ComGC
MSQYSKNNQGLSGSSSTKSSARTKRSDGFWWEGLSSRAGFTVIELLVSFGIVAVILTVVVLNQSVYTDRAAVINLADEISLTISQAQAYGIGVREFAPGSSDFNISYGLTFSLLGSGANNAYLYYADRDGDNFYDGNWSCPVGGTSECLERVDISRGNYIESLCVVRTSGSDICNVGRVDITFVRPNTETNLRFFNGSGGSFNPPNMRGVRVVLESPGGSTRSVIIYSTGQISVQ